MIITFKEFANEFKGSAMVYVGRFRWENEGENPLRREFEKICICKDVEAFSKFCLNPDYQLDVYTDVNEDILKPTTINTESKELNLTADKVYIIAPRFGDDLRVAYVRKNRYSVVKRALALASKELAHWIKGNYDLQKKVEIALVEGPWRYDYVLVPERTRDSNECDKKARHIVSQAKAAFRRWLKSRNITEAEYFDYVALKAKEEKEAAKAKAAHEKRVAKNHTYINEHIVINNHKGERVNSDYKSLIINHINIGTNTGDFDAQISSENEITCDEERDFNGYAKSCHFTMIRRSFTLHLKKGYNIYVIGGLITFIRGEIKRDGVACEWIEQGRAIADIHTVKGFLVRGEHVVANSLKSAQKQVRETRNQRALKMMNDRNKKLRTDKKLANHMFTFDESVASGNCRPGTMNFKNRYEAAIGHEAKEISLADLRKYGKLFGLELYTERVVNYVMRTL